MEMESNMVDYYFDYVLDLVKKAGIVLLEAKNLKIERKDDLPWDLVTQFDRKIEEILIQEIRKKFPTHKFIGEEETALKKCDPVLTDDPTWLIDPIDGTGNFIRQIPITCISVGLTIKKVQMLGIIYNPFMDELYTAIKGRGAFFNGQPMSVTHCKDLTKTTFAYELTLAFNKKLRDMYLNRFRALCSAPLSSMRSFGCAAMSLCYVASGQIDAYQCDGLYPWDAAAGVLIVREAGGFVCDSSKENLGGKFDLMAPNFLACSSEELAGKIAAIERCADQTY